MESRAIETSKYISGFHRRSFEARKSLPHLKVTGGTYFVTYRLADSLPATALKELEEELHLKKISPEFPEEKQNEEINRERFRRIEAWLDAGSGSCCLKQPELAEIIVENLRFHAGARYDLRAWVIMPNHVHVLVKPLESYSLSQILKTWKQYSSRRAKELLQWNLPRFWQVESYDRWTRDAEERERIIRYIHKNPVKANLCKNPEDWPWSSAKEFAAHEAEISYRG